MKPRDSFFGWMLTLGGGLLIGMFLGLLVKNNSGGMPSDRWSNSSDSWPSESWPSDSWEGTRGIAGSATHVDLEALFPGRLVLRRATLEDLQRVEDKGAVTELFLDVPRLSATDYQVLSQFPSLRHLRVRAGGVDDPIVHEIAQLPGLEQLNLPQAEFTDAGIAAVTGMSQLELFRFGSPHVTDEGLRSVAAIPRLRFLHVIDTPITDRGLVYLQGAQRLESFYIDGSDITDQGIEVFLEAMPEVHFHIDQLHDDRDPRRH